MLSRAASFLYSRSQIPICGPNARAKSTIPPPIRLAADADNRNCRGRPLSRESCYGTASREDDRNLNLHKLGCQGGQLVKFALSPAKCDVHILSLQVARLRQALTEGSYNWRRLAW